MTKLEIVKTDGTKVGALDLPVLFQIEPKKALLHQAITAYLANARQSPAHTKTRGEVSGGGRKPWKQKGTGRARVGSSRSPLWRGGGITFGPIAGANNGKRLPVKMKRLALSMALSAKASEGRIIVIDELTLKTPKTKEAALVVKQLCPEARSVLLVSCNAPFPVRQAFRNLPSVALAQAADLNAYDTLKYDYLVFTKEAIGLTEKQLSSKTEEETNEIA